VFGIEGNKFSPEFMVLILFAGIIARACSVFIPTLILSLFNKFDLRIKMKQVSLIWFSGIIRGAIAFGLSMQINKDIAPNRSLMVSTTLLIVLITTLVLGGSMSIFTKVIGLKVETNQIENAFETNEGLLKSKRKEGKLLISWNNFNNKYLKPVFGGEIDKDYVIPHHPVPSFDQSPAQNYISPSKRVSSDSINKVAGAYNNEY
jgi:hypothetical protein